MWQKPKPGTRLLCEEKWEPPKTRMGTNPVVDAVNGLGSAVRVIDSVIEGSEGRHPSGEEGRSRLDSAVAAIDDDHLPADEVGGGRGLVEDQIGDLDLLAEAMQRDPGFHRAAFGLVAPGLFGHVSEDDGRRDGVRLDVKLPPLGGHDLRQVIHTGFGRAVGPLAFASRNARDGRNVNDFAASLLWNDHGGAGPLPVGPLRR